MFEKLGCKDRWSEIAMSLVAAHLFACQPMAGCKWEGSHQAPGNFVANALEKPGVSMHQSSGDVASGFDRIARAILAFKAWPRHAHKHA